MCLCEQNMWPQYLPRNKLNRPFYSCLRSELAFEWQRGWGWPCFDANLLFFCWENHVLLMLISAFTWQKERGLHQRKVTFCLVAIRRPGHRTDNCKMVYWANDTFLWIELSCKLWLFEWPEHLQYSKPWQVCKCPDTKCRVVITI